MELRKRVIFLLQLLQYNIGKRTIWISPLQKRKCFTPKREEVGKRIAHGASCRVIPNVQTSDQTTAPVHWPDQWHLKTLRKTLAILSLSVTSINVISSYLLHFFSVEFLTTSSTGPRGPTCTCNWLMQGTFLPMTHYSTDVQVVVMYQQKQQCANKGGEK